MEKLEKGIKKRKKEGGGETGARRNRGDTKLSRFGGSTREAKDRMRHERLGGRAI